MATRKPRSKTNCTEAQLQKYGTDLLELDGWRSLRTDPVSDRGRGKGFGEIGMADYLYLRYRYMDSLVGHPQRDYVSECFWIEWKKVGGKAAIHQLDWHRAERARGALTLIAGVDFEATPEGFLAWYRESGLMRREIK